MKKILLISILWCAALRLAAQAPQEFSFQGVAKNAGGQIIANTQIAIRLTVHETLPLGANLYQETHTPTTSPGGVFTIFVGAGYPVNGVFEDINWASGVYFLQVEIDPAGGTNYTSLGATQLVSVPYALHATQSDKWKNDDAVVQKGELKEGGGLGDVGIGSRLIWYPRKAAFRAGYIFDDAWNDNMIGSYSTAFGSNTQASSQGSLAGGHASKASGAFSFAMGFNSQASGQESFAIGDDSRANGNASIAMGYLARAIGFASLSAGNGTIAKSAGSAAFGSYNDDSDSPDGADKPLDRIFQVGNGSLNDDRSNAITVLRNGHIGLGKNVLVPEYVLDIGARARIRHNPGFSAGLFFDDSNGKAEGFVGMKTNSELGFYNADKWTFWMDNLGNAHIVGSNYNTSDSRLKRDFSPLDNSLNKLVGLKGYHYFWKDKTVDQRLQTGLIAQEVEVQFPELVSTDDKGFKSVNYTGLIPHLIESVKVLKEMVKDLESENEDLSKLNMKLKSVAFENEELRRKISQLLDMDKRLENIEARLQNVANPIESTLEASKK
jgi:hypothetical protein